MTSTEPTLATLHELNTIYTVKDLYDMLEIIDAKHAMETIVSRKIKQREAAEKEKNNAKHRR